MRELEKTLSRMIENFRGRIIVHIGPGFHYPGTENGIRVGENELHLCFEPDPVHGALTQVPKNSHVEHIPYKFEQVNLPTNSIDHIHAHNVITKSQMGLALPGVIASAYRTLKPGGTMAISEMITPESKRRQELEGLAQKTGFNQKYLISPTKKPLDPGQLNLLLRHCGMGRYMLALMTPVSEGSYLVELKK